jgi:TRAP-type C4-dicarboxylate transport system permease small subunit
MEIAARSWPAQLLMRVNRYCAVLSGMAMLLMMVAGAADVITTNLDLVGLASRPIPGVHEFVATMMVFSVFLALALAQARRAHIQVDLFTRVMPRPARAALAMLQSALAIVVFGLMAWFSWKTAWHALLTGEFAAGLLDFPLWPARVALAFGVTLLLVQFFFDLVSTGAPHWRTTPEPPAR